MNKINLYLIFMLLTIISCTRHADNGNALWLPEGDPKVNAEVVVDESLDLINDGFMIKDTPEGRKIMAKTEIGALYGTYALQRLERTGKAGGTLDIREEPSYERRILNHWDNPDLTVERGYAGQSLWKWESLPEAVLPVYEEYARANAYKNERPAPRANTIPPLSSISGTNDIKIVDK